jgi:hypothetical protein
MMARLWKEEPLRRVGVLVGVLAAAVLGGCRVARLTPVATRAGATVPDLARKAGTVAASAPSPGPAARAVVVRPPRVSVEAAGGWAFLDGALDLEDGPYGTVRVATAIGRGLDAVASAKAIFTSRDVTTVSSGGGTSAPPSTSTTEEHGALLLLDAGVRRRFRLPLGRGGVHGTVGVGGGIGFLAGLDEHDVAPDLTAWGTLDLLRGRHLRLGIDVQGHFLDTDVGGGDRAWRPIGAVGLSVTWEP